MSGATVAGLALQLETIARALRSAGSAVDPATLDALERQVRALRGAILDAVDPETAPSPTAASAPPRRRRR